MQLDTMKNELLFLFLLLLKGDQLLEPFALLAHSLYLRRFLIHLETELISNLISIDVSSEHGVFP